MDMGACIKKMDPFSWATSNKGRHVETAISFPKMGISTTEECTTIKQTIKQAVIGVLASNTMEEWLIMNSRAREKKLVIITNSLGSISKIEKFKGF